MKAILHRLFLTKIYLPNLSPLWNWFSNLFFTLYKWFYKRSLTFLKFGNFFFVIHLNVLYFSNAINYDEYHPTWADFMYFISDKVLIFSLFLCNITRPKNKYFRYEILGMAIFSLIRIIYAVGEMINWYAFNNATSLVILAAIAAFMFGYIVIYNIALVADQRLFKKWKKMET